MEKHLFCTLLSIPTATAYVSSLFYLKLMSWLYYLRTHIYRMALGNGMLLGNISQHLELYDVRV